MRTFAELYVDGRWAAPAGRGTIPVVSASTEEVIGSVPEGDAADVDRAVQAAARAFPAWAATASAERARHLERLRQALTERAEDIAQTIAGEVGMPLGFSRLIQAALPATILGTYAQLLEGFAFEETVGN